MKKIVSTGMAVIGIAALVLAGVNVNLNSKSSKMSVVAVKNWEALTREGESGWYKVEVSSERTDNGSVVSQTKTVDCSEGGPSTSCTPSCKIRIQSLQEAKSITQNSVFFRNIFFKKQ